MNTESFKTRSPGRTVREKSIENYLSRKVRQAGGLCWKFASPGRSGVPDRLVLFKGFAVFVELKRPGQKPRELQQIRMNELRDVGAWVEVISNKDEADTFLAKLNALNGSKVNNAVHTA